MELYEHNTCSFIIKLWVEEPDDPTSYLNWRGHITQVHSGQRRYFEDLAYIGHFILPYLETMCGAVNQSVMADGGKTMTNAVNVYLYPYPLTPGDELVDGDTPFPLKDNTLLIWIDRQPEAKFEHETAYVLISPTDVRVETGKSWPKLNGNTILYGARNPVALLSPFVIDHFEI